VNGYLIDTDWAINYMLGKADTVSVVDGLPDDETFISIISVAELYEGVFLAQDTDEALRILHGFLAGVALLGIDAQTARLFGERRAELRRAGRLIDHLDLLIGATCLRRNLRLLTNNVRHFERIEGLEIGLAE